MKIVEALLQHHEEIRDLFEQTKNNSRNFDKLKKNLDVHHRMEEKYLLDISKKKEDLKDESLESIEEHYAIVMLVEDLENFPKNDERWKVKLKVLKELIDHHFEEEEEELFPKATKDFPDEKLEQLGEDYQKSKEEQLAVL
jgi:hypothetical protein